MSLIEQAEAALTTRVASIGSNIGAYGGSVVTVLAWLGSQDVAAGIASFVALSGLVLSIYHRRALRNIDARDRAERRRIELAQLTDDQRAAYERLKAEDAGH